MAVTIDGSAGVTTNAGGSVNPSTNVDGINYSCRAWVNFNGTGTVAIRASGNVTSITDNGVGSYRVNFTTAMSDANYACVTSCSSAGGNNGLAAPYSAGTTTSQAIITTVANSAATSDVSFAHVAIFR